MSKTTDRKQWPFSVVRVVYVLTALAVFSNLLVGALISLPLKIIDGGGAPDIVQACTLTLAVISLALGFGPNYRARRARVAAALFSAVFSMLMAAQVVRLMGGRRYTWHPRIEITICAALIVSQMFVLAALLCIGEDDRARRGAT